MRRILAGVLMLAVGTTLIAGCASNASPEPPSLASGPSGVPTDPLETPSKAQLEHAVDLRRLLGLRADRPFVNALFSDLPAVERGLESTYSIPLTAAELEQLERQQREGDATIAAIERYAETVRDAWAGLYVDTATRDIVVHFAGPLAIHEEALEPLLSANAPLRIVGVEWSLVELELFREAVRSDLDWLSEVDTRFQGLGVDLVGNRVELEVQSTRPDIVDVIRAHYGGSPMLSVRVETRAPWTGGRGTLFVDVEHEDGSPVENHECSLVPDDPAAWGEDVSTTGDIGRCTFNNVGATRVRILLTREADRKLVGGETATVLEGETVTVRIVIHEQP